MGKKRTMSETTHNTEEEVVIPPCYKLYDMMHKCRKISNLIQYRYIYGTFPDCDPIKKAVFACAKLKAYRDNEEYKKVVLDFLQEAKNLPEKSEKSSGSVWEFRENPAADWWKTRSQEVEEERKKLEEETKT